MSLICRSISWLKVLLRNATVRSSVTRTHTYHFIRTWWFLEVLAANATQYMAWPISKRWNRWGFYQWIWLNWSIKIKEEKVFCCHTYMSPVIDSLWHKPNYLQNRCSYMYTGPNLILKYDKRLKIHFLKSWRED